MGGRNYRFLSDVRTAVIKVRACKKWKIGNGRYTGVKDF